MAFLPFILKRARRHWQLLLTLSLGVMMATALLASGPLLVDAVVELGLTLTLRSSSVGDANLRLTTSREVDRLNVKAFKAFDSEIKALLSSSLGRHLELVTLSAESQWMFPWVGGRLAEDQRVKLCFYEGTQDHVEYVAGAWPGEPTDDTAVVRAVISDGMARAFALRAGDRLPLSLKEDGDLPDIWIEVAGVVQPRNPRDPYWFGELSPLTARSSDEWLGEYSVVVPAESFLTVVALLSSGEKTALSWHVLLRHDAFSVADIEPFQVQLADLTAELDRLEPPVTLVTEIPSILTRFQVQLESIRVPIYILIAEVMLLVLYYVTMVAALLMRQVEREFAILRSRGASARQITVIQSIEALAIIVVAFLSGPWLGVGLVKGLSFVGPLADVGQGGR
ncbi:MAG: hypothetical protein PVI63_09920, partial [Anaerolineae bacterium]